VHCPRCGTPFEQGDRYCASCGADLRQASEPPRERRSLRERASALIGTTRRARLITAGTVVAIAIAIVAFILLDPAEDEIPRDAYTVAADEICVGAKKQIAAAAGRSAAGEDPGAYADRLVPIVSGWRSEFNALDPPPDRQDQAQTLDAALRDVQVESGALARVAREGSRKEVLEASGRVDDLTIAVEENLAALNLDRCADLALGAPEPQ